MMALLILKSKLKNFYEKHYRLVRGISKGIIMFLILLVTTSQMNYVSILNHYPLLVILAVLCGVVPDIISLLTIAIVVLMELLQISPVLSVVFFMLLVTYYLLFGRLTEKQGIILAAIPLMSVIRMEYLVPIVAGLFFTPIMIPAFVMGIFLRFFFAGVQEYALAASRTTGTNSPIASLQYVVEYMKDNPLMIITLAAFLFTFLCVYLIRRTKLQYASQVAILVGAILVLSIMLLGNIGLDLEVNLWQLIVSIVVSVILAYIIQFFHMSLEYRGTRKLQFEDDEYYYYVTAVPKLKVAVEEKKVTRIVPDEEDENLDLKAELEKTFVEEESEKF